MNTHQYSNALLVDKDARIEELKIDVLWYRNNKQPDQMKYAALKLAKEIGDDAARAWLMNFGLEGLLANDPVNGVA